MMLMDDYEMEDYKEFVPKELVLSCFYDWIESHGYKYSTAAREMMAEIKKLPSVQQLIVSDWISVNDRLPYAEYGESPTVYCYFHDVVRGGRWSEMLYYNGGVWCKPTGETFDYKVLAWYPLPKKPYREKV